MENQSLENQIIAVGKDKNVHSESFLKELPTVERVIWTDQTNSAGDGWSGLIVEKVGDDEYNLIEFYQEHNYFNGEGKKFYFSKSILKYPVPLEAIDYIIADIFGKNNFNDEENDEDIEEPVSKNIKKQEDYVQLNLTFE